MTLGLKSKDLSYLFVCTLVLVSINLWSFSGLTSFMNNAIDAVMLSLLVLMVATRSGIFLRRGLHFKGLVLLLMVGTVPSMFGAALYHNQTISQSLYMSRGSLFWLTYFLLHIFNIPRERIVKLLVFTGAMWAFLTIVQQFTYPRYYFYSRDDEKKSIYRAGVYRYMISGQLFGLFTLLYHFYKYLTTNKIWHAAWVGFGLLGFYYFGTRQNALAAAACMVFAAMLLKGLAKWKNLMLIAGLGLVAFGMKEVLFGEYIDMTNRQLQYEEDDIRLISARFFLLEYWPESGWAKLIGNGRPYAHNAYGREMMMINTGLRLFRSDVGIIGSFNQYGLLYVILVAFFLLKGLTLTINISEHKYLKLFFIYSSGILILSESFSGPGTIVFYSCVLYLIDKAKAEENEINLMERQVPQFNNQMLAPLPVS